jgi:LAO/AO transport system kinase
VAGPAGVGKSSLLRELIRRLRRRGERVALLACDPASAVTGGAVLADRCRLGELMEDAGVFCRSLAHRGAAGEPAPGLETALEVLEAAGFPWIFVETVGTGQMEARAAGPVETQVLVLSPQCGDDFQMLKAGALEVADLVVVNKGDQPGGRAWAALLAETLGVEKDAGGADGEGSGGGKEAGGEPRRSRAPRVLGVSAATGEGVEALLSALVEAGGAGGIVAGAQTQGVTSA